MVLEFTTESGSWTFGTKGIFAENGSWKLCNNGKGSGREWFLNWLSVVCHWWLIWCAEASVVYLPLFYVRFYPRMRLHKMKPVDTHSFYYGHITMSKFYYMGHTYVRSQNMGYWCSLHASTLVLKMFVLVVKGKIQFVIALVTLLLRKAFCLILNFRCCGKVICECKLTGWRKRLLRLTWCACDSVTLTMTTATPGHPGTLACFIERAFGLVIWY